VEAVAMTLTHPTGPPVPPGGLAARIWMVLRGLGRVARFLTGAVWALVAAALGVPVRLPSRLGHLLADEYRAGRVGAVDAEVIDADPAPDPAGESAAGPASGSVRDVGSMEVGS
jgi:hypothetical protein